MRLGVSCCHGGLATVDVVERRVGVGVSLRVKVSEMWFCFWCELLVFGSLIYDSKSANNFNDFLDVFIMA